MAGAVSSSGVHVVGRYALCGAIASGGMASVHLGRLVGAAGFSRVVAIKKLHEHFANDPDFVAMLVDEARLASRIRHPNVIPTLDVVATGAELLLVMEYVPGESLARLLRASALAGARVALPFVSAVLSGALRGLHAAHEARSERGVPLGIVHRDVSPQNIVVGVDGVPRVLDFGVAKAAGRLQTTTREGSIKGKLAYMAPEQVRGAPLDRRTDVYAAGVVLWEMLTGQRLFTGDNDAALLARVLGERVDPPSARVPRDALAEPAAAACFARLDRIVLHAVARNAAERFRTAMEMAEELEACVPPAAAAELGRWVERTVPQEIERRTRMLEAVEQLSIPPPSDPDATGPARAASGAGGASGVQPAVLARVSSPALEAPSGELRSGATQMSSASGLSSVDVAIEQQRRTLAVATVALLSALVAIAVLAVVVLVQRVRPSAAVVPPAASPVAARPQPPPQPSSSLAGASPEATPPATTPSVASAAPPRRTVIAPAPPRPPRPAAPGSDCNPNFFYDAKGVKRYKPECPL